MQQKLQKLKTNFLFFLELQLLISLVILPILIAWGLPISMMSIVGNLVFAQFLSIFIFLSALLFSSNLLGISNYFITQALELVTNIWYYFLSFGSAYWLIGLPLWIFPISLGSAIIVCVMYHTNTYNQSKRILILGILLVMIFTINQIFQPRYAQATMIHGASKIHFIKVHHKIYAFDCGALGARPSSQSWIEYTLIPSLIKSMGATSIDTLVLCKSNSRTHQAVNQFIQRIPTKHLIEINQA